MSETNEKLNQPAETSETAEPVVDSTQKVEMNAYVPTYRIKPELKKALLQCIGDLPFNQIAGIVQAVEVEIMDHQTLTQVVNGIGQFPFQRVENLMKNINNFVEQIIQD